MMPSNDKSSNVPNTVPNTVPNQTKPGAKTKVKTISRIHINKKKLAWFALLLALVGLVYLILVPRPVPVEIAHVSRGDFEETILADGILRAKNRYVVSAFADGDIKRVELKMGDPIQKGAIITELFWDVKYDPVRAPMNGVISKVFRDSSGPIRRGEAIVEILDPSQLEIVAELLTTDAIRLEKGAQVRILNWPNEVAITGEVSRVSKAGFAKPSALGVEEERTEVTAELHQMPKDFMQKAGSSFHVDLVFRVALAQSVLKIPIGAVFRDGNAWAVFTFENGRAIKRSIELNGRNSTEAWISSGLTEGQFVIVYPGDLVSNGSRVKELN